MVSANSQPYNLSEEIAAQVRPMYKRLLKRGVNADLAYSEAYERIVELIAQAQDTTVDKVRFSSRDILQYTMKLVTL